MEDEEYELTPHHQIEELRKEVARLRKNPFAGTRSSRDLLSAMDKLGDSINNLIELFKAAGHSMKEEEAESPFDKKLNMLMDQNRKIAEGLIAVTEMVKREHATPHVVHHEAPHPVPRPMPRPAPRPVMPAAPSFAPRPEAPMPPPLPPLEPLGRGVPAPPMPPAAPKKGKKGLFGKF